MILNIIMILVFIFIICVAIFDDHKNSKAETKEKTNKENKCN